MDGFKYIVGVGVLEGVSQKVSRWSSENGILEIEPMEAVQSFEMTVCIEKKEAEVGWKIRSL